MPGLLSSSVAEGDQSISAYLRSQCPFLSSTDGDQSASPDARKTASSMKDATDTPLIAPAVRRQNRRSHEVPAAVSQTSPKKKFSVSPRKQPFLSSPSKGPPPSRNNRARKNLTLAAFLPNGEGGKKANDDAKLAPLFSVESNDDFPSLGAATPATLPVKPLQIRRIRPTPIAPVGTSERNFTTEELSTFSSMKSSPASATTIDASEREKLLTKRLDSADPVTTPAKAPQFNAADKDCVKAEIDPCSDLVTRRDELDAAAQTFIQFLEMECTAVFRELQFLVALLCVHSSDAPNENTESLLLGSVHNCVYLACTILQELEWLIIGLDDHFIEELASNDRLSKFAACFCDKLRSVQPLRKSAPENSTFDSLSQPVNLKRDEFPDQTSFHSFKRQRDIYHEIKRDYDEMPCEKDVAYFESFGNRVRGLIKSGSHTLNYALLAQLFISEIVKKDADNINSSSHQNFPDADVERLNRLTRRLTTCDSDDTTSIYGRKAKFVGRERFFRDFLLHSDSYLFTTTLRDQLWAKIKFICRLCREQKGDITALLSAACLLAKFLGYITFQPYQQFHQFPASLCETSHESDSITLQVIVLLESLLKSDDCIEICLCAIAICHFLSTADVSFLSRENNKGLVFLLLTAFRCMVHAQRTRSSPIYMCAIFHVDSLLSMPHMTGVSWPPGKAKIVNERDWTRNATDCAQQITIRLNDTCPWLSSLHSSLLGNKQSSDTPTQRKIRPITLSTVVNQQGDNASHNRILVEMERQFFAQQPAFVRKVVDTVTECFTQPTLSSSEIDEPAVREAIRSLLSKCSSDCVIDVAQKLAIRNLGRHLSERPPPKNGTDVNVQRDEPLSTNPAPDESFQELGPLLQRMREVTIECVERRACPEAVKAVISDYRNAEDQHEQLRRPFVRTATAQMLAILEFSQQE